MALIALILLGLMTIINGCAADAPATSNRPQTTTQFLAQPRPAP